MNQFPIVDYRFWIGVRNRTSAVIERHSIQFPGDSESTIHHPPSTITHVHVQSN